MRDPRRAIPKWSRGSLRLPGWRTAGGELQRFQLRAMRMRAGSWARSIARDSPRWARRQRILNWIWLGKNHEEEIPNPKLQAPGKLQIPSFKAQAAKNHFQARYG